MESAVLRAIEEGNITLDDMPKELRDNPDIVLEFCIADASAMLYASDRLKNDKIFAHTLAENSLNCMEYLSPLIQDDKRVALHSVKSNGYTLEYVSDRLKRDPEVLELARTYFGDIPSVLIPEAIRTLI